MAELAVKQASVVPSRPFSLDRASSVAAPLVVFVLALLTRWLVVAVSHFDGLYGQDAYAYFAFARQMFDALAGGHLPPPFWWPLGYPLLLNAGFLFLGESVQTAQIVTLLTGAAIAPVTMLLTRELAGNGKMGLAALVASLIVALSGQAVQSSVVIMADAPGLLWASVAVWLFLRYRRTNSLPSLFVSSLSLGLAVITRWENLPLAFVWLCLCLALALSSLKSVTATNRILAVVSHGLFPLSILGLVVLPQFVLQVSNGSPFAGQSWLEAWNPANAFARVFDNVDGHFEYQLPIAAFYAQVLFHPAYLFPLLTPFFAIGAWLIAKRRMADSSSAFLLLGWIASLLLFLPGIPYENFRFGLGFLVPVAVVSGVGLESIWVKLGRTSAGQRRTLFQISFILLLSISLLGLAFWESRTIQPILARKQLELTLAQWADARVPPGGTLFSFDATAALQMYSHLPVKEISEETPDRIMQTVRVSRPAYLLIDMPAVEKQWRGHQLGDTLAVLRDSSALIRLDSIESWTLYKVGPSP